MLFLRNYTKSTLFNINGLYPLLEYTVPTGL